MVRSLVMATQHTPLSLICLTLVYGLLILYLSLPYHSYGTTLHPHLDKPCLSTTHGAPCILHALLSSPCYIYGIAFIFILGSPLLTNTNSLYTHMYISPLYLQSNPKFDLLFIYLFNIVLCSSSHSFATITSSTTVILSV